MLLLHQLEKSTLLPAFGRWVCSLAGGEKRDSEETGLPKTVASGGAWHSEEKSEEAQMTIPNFGPNRRHNKMGLRSWHREEKLRRPSWPGPSLGPKCRWLADTTYGLGHFGGGLARYRGGGYDVPLFVPLVRQGSRNEMGGIKVDRIRYRRWGGGGDQW